MQRPRGKKDLERASEWLNDDDDDGEDALCTAQNVDLANGMCVDCVGKTYNLNK